MTHPLLRINHAFLNNPVARIGLRPTPALDRLPVYTELEAWLILNSMPFTRQLIPGLKGNDISLTWSGIHIVTDFARLWNWTPDKAEEWFATLMACGLITEELYAELLPSIVWPRRRRRPRKCLSRVTRETVLAKTSGLCVYCGVRLTTNPGQPHSYHADHVLPVDRGGSDDLANLIPSCARCNMAKSAKTFVTFMGVRGE
jgi:hypothetical protein